MVGEDRKNFWMMGPGTKTSQEATLGLGLKEMEPWEEEENQEEGGEGGV